MATRESDYNLPTTIKLRPASLFGGASPCSSYHRASLAIIGD